MSSVSSFQTPHGIGLAYVSGEILLYWAEVLVIYYVWADAHMCINVEVVFFRQYNAIGGQKDEFDHFACGETYLEYT